MQTILVLSSEELMTFQYDKKAVCCLTEWSGDRRWDMKHWTNPYEHQG